jgi:hypothetical protein
MSVLKAPVMLGLFLLLTIPLYCEEPAFRFDDRGGWLWADNAGDVLFHRQSIGVEQTDFWHLSFAGEKLSAQHRQLTVQGGAFFLEGGIRGPLGGINIGLGFYSHGNLELLRGEQLFENDGGKASSFTLSVPVYFNQNSLIFSYTGASASWQDGSFYWFFGRPRLDAFHLGNLSFVFGKQSIGLGGLFLDRRILSPEDTDLFTFSLWGFHAFYNFRKDFRVLRLNGNAGILYGKARFDGSLTASNQHYSIFPYLVYEASGQIGAFAGYAMVTLAYRAGFFSLTTQLGVLQVFYDNCDADVYYKQKTLFGGGERRYTFTPINLEGLGCALAGIDAAFLFPDSKTKPNFTIGIKKIFLVPWNYQQIISPDGSRGTGSTFVISADFLKTALLSGLSLYLSVKF